MLPIDSAKIVSNWTGLGGDRLPKEFVDAINLFDHIQYIEVGHEPSFDFASLTAANAEEVIHNLASQISLARTSGENGPLAKAKNQVLDIAARHVLSTARGAVPALIEKLTPLLKKHAEAYAEAVAQLPEDITAEGILAAGPGATAAYQTAKSVLPALAQLDSWVAQTSYVAGYTGKVDPVLRLLRPANAVELGILDAAYHKTNVDKALKDLNPLFVAAARNGIEWGFNTPDACGKLRRDLTTVSSSKIRFN